MNSKEITKFEKVLYKNFDWLYIIFKVISGDKNKYCILLMHKDGVPQNDGEMDTHHDVRIFNYHFGYQWHNLSILNEEYFYWSFNHILNPPIASKYNTNYRASQISGQLILQGKAPILSRTADKLEHCLDTFALGMGPLTKVDCRLDENTYIPKAIEDSERGNYISHSLGSLDEDKLANIYIEEVYKGLFKNSEIIIPKLKKEMLVKRNKLERIGEYRAFKKLRKGDK
tara:strand:+ start:1777 stop:2460 length:684 start_codon:yes stop_codon:yes gene_type:complete